MSKYFQGVFLLAIFAIASQAEAASLYIDPPTPTLNRGDSVTLSVRLDTDEDRNECVNVVDGVMKYTSNVEPVDVSIGQSIFSTWVEEPKINKENRTITFAGGIPNGYCGRIPGDPRLTNTIVDIIFMSPGFVIGGSSEPEATVEFAEETTAYLNDGLGTKAPLRTFPAKLTLNSKAGNILVNDWKEAIEADDVPPEEFSITLHQDEKAFGGRHFIVFSTTDKQTGLDTYQVMEEPVSSFNPFGWGRADAPWVEARSPYVLEDQTLRSVVRVRAFDKAGNEYVATLVPEESRASISTPDSMMNLVLGFGVLVLLTILTAAGFWFYRRMKRNNNDEEINTHEEFEPNDTENHEDLEDELNDETHE